MFSITSLYFWFINLRFSFIVGVSSSSSAVSCVSIRENFFICSTFANVEQIKKFSLIDTQLTAEDDELTPTMKLKRKFINQKYSDVIENMYQSA